jgi:hypothetical protein
MIYMVYKVLNLRVTYRKNSETYMNARLKPNKGEYDPYFEHYLSLLPERDLMELLVAQMGEAEDFFMEEEDEWLITPFQPCKWSPKELLGHVNDTERVMSYRALCIGRGDLQPLPGWSLRQDK